MWEISHVQVGSFATVPRRLFQTRASVTQKKKRHWGLGRFMMNPRRKRASTLHLTWSHDILTKLSCMSSAP